MNKIEIEKVAKSLTEIINIDNVKKAENTFKILGQCMIKMLEKMSKVNIDFINGAENLCEKNKRMFTKMLENGWYFSSNIPLGFWQMNDLDDESFNNEIYKFYKSIFDKMVENIINEFTNRSQILNEAICNHKLKMYCVSIPTFLSQIDGISKEMIGSSLISRVKGKEIPLTKIKRKPELIKQKYNYRDDFYLASLDVLSQVFKEYKNGESNFFNRHGVLHGFDTGYGTEINSLKCIVILNYLVELKKYYFKNPIN